MKFNEIIANKITHIRKKIFNENQQEFADRINISKRTVSNLETAKGDYNLSLLEKLASIADKSIFWLFGVEDESKIVNQNILEDKKNEVLTHSVKINVYHDLFFSAGEGNSIINCTPSVISFDKSFLKQLHKIDDFKEIDLVRIQGHSMKPIFNDGDYVFVQRNIKPVNGDFIIAGLDNNIYAKRFYQEPLNGVIKLVSENKEYDDILLSNDKQKNMLNIYAIVKSRVTTFC